MIRSASCANNVPINWCGLDGEYAYAAVELVPSQFTFRLSPVVVYVVPVIAGTREVEFVGAARNSAVGPRCGRTRWRVGFDVLPGNFIGSSSVPFFHDDFYLSGSPLRQQVGYTTELARALTILERSARCGTHVVVPLFGMTVVDSTGVAVLVSEPMVARRAEQFRVRSVDRGLAVQVARAREQPLYLVQKGGGRHRLDEDGIGTGRAGTVQLLRACLCGDDENWDPPGR
jgi:hypothetical protein